MTYQGKVQAGVVVLTDGVTLPEGTEVTVEPCPATATSSAAQPQPTIWEKMADLARWVETQPCDLPEDLAINHDHYLHGLPKQK